MATSCRTTGTAAPTESQPRIAQAQYSFTPSSRLGVAISISHDFEGDLTGVEVPLFLVPDDKTGLFNGGVKVSWQSATKDTTFLLFVGLPFGSF